MRTFALKLGAFNDAALTFAAQQSGANVEVLISNGTPVVLQNTQLSSLAGDCIGH